MKGLLAITALLILVAVIGVYEGYYTPQDRSVAANAEQSKTEPQRPRTTEAFDEDGFIRAMNEEPQVKDAAITDGGSLYIGVLDNGLDRRGYAMYICEVAREHAAGNVRRKLVKIIDIAAAARDEGIKELGRYWCEFKV